MLAVMDNRRKWYRGARDGPCPRPRTLLLVEDISTLDVLVYDGGLELRKVLARKGDDAKIVTL
jgi:hypothetical protein